VRHAARIGVRILAGTDAGMVPHGRIRDEVRRLVEAGVPAEQALGAASWDARAYLGLPGIEAGAPADLVVFERDPRAEVDSLPAAALCLLDGRLVVRGSLA
jgi:imidazolonepropionase-like amidohydrolase